MATRTVQLNTRIDEALKRGGDSVFGRYGLSPSDVVRAVWRYAVEYQVPPDFMLADEADREGDRLARRRLLAREGRGLAASLAERSGVHLDRDALACGQDWSQVRDEMYDDLDREMVEACR